ncbi:MAG TPA: hypothetical protein ENJ23_04195 [Bacteroidetes bacterium]|nr:hypothetical protein [Bacteroidota bacterium]
MRRNLLLLAFIFLFMVVVGLISLTPNVKVAGYFGNGELPRDVIGQFEYLKRISGDQPADSFRGYEGVPQRQWKFQVAFLYYATACLIQRDPRLAREGVPLMRRLLAKMQSRPVWEDWITDGYGEDPLAKNNMMYRGHLSLMLNLYQAVTGDTIYARRASEVTLALHREALQHPFFGVPCEPNNYYIACNSVAQLSYCVYDKLHGTDLRSIRNSWLAWIRAHMLDSKTGLLATVYHPAEDRVEWYQTARHNGWDIVFLSAVAPAFADSLYQNYRKQMVRSFGGFAWAVTRPGGWWPDKPGAGFALAAAHAMGDAATFRFFLRSLQLAGKPQWEGNSLHYARSNLLGDTILLFGKVCSFRELLNAPFPVLGNSCESEQEGRSGASSQAGGE